MFKENNNRWHFPGKPTFLTIKRGSQILIARFTGVGLITILHLFAIIFIW